MNTRLIYNFAIISSLLISPLVFAAPEGGVVAAGTADISQSGNITTINQSTPSAVINWHGFNTASNESVVFNQPNSNSTVLNRINSGLPTNFAGSLSANGKVFIVNPAGMVFAQGSKINAASFIATTADIKDADFMQGQYKFAMSTDSHPTEVSIINNGSITANDYGSVALVAPNVINAEQGVITASEGNVVLATGKAFVLDFNQDGLINFDVTSLITNGHIVNAGKISAYDGNVFMTTNTVSNILTSMSPRGGIKEANNMIVNARGEIVLTNTSEPYAAGTITNTGEISTKYVKIKADNGINLGGKITSDGWIFGNIEASTQKGDLILNGSLSAPRYITLNSALGAINLTDTGRIVAKYTTLTANTGITLAGTISTPRMTFEEINISTLNGDITLTGTLFARTITLTAKQGAIKKSDQGMIYALTLYLYSPLPAPDLTALHRYHNILDVFINGYYENFERIG